MSTELVPWVVDRLAALRMVPVVVIDDAAHADRLADALLDGGIACAEITLRTPAGLAAIRRLSHRGDILVGAGTIVNPDDVDAAVDAGAEFLVSPGFGIEVARRARARGVALLPGVATASELQAAVAAGISSVKLFPAEALGGIVMLDALGGPFPQARFMPSGGITLEKAGGYLDHPAVFAVGGSWIAPRAQIAAGDFRAITESAARTVAILEIGVSRVDRS